MVKTQARGYYRMMLGDCELTALSDGTLGLDPVNNLKVASDQQEQVDEIYIAHMHGDDVGGLMAGPGLGRLGAEGSGYPWIPANDSSLR